MKDFSVVALTGHSGTGKSYAAAYLNRKGFPVLDSDRVAREVVEPRQPALLELIRVFGERIVNADETLNRQMLADIAFATHAGQELLNRTLHPYIVKRLLEKCRELKEAGFKHAVVEAGALFESGFEKYCDKIVLIVASKETSVNRIMRRDKLTREQALSRLAAQIPETSARERCDIILSNDGELREFDQKLETLYQTLNNELELNVLCAT